MNFSTPIHVENLPDFPRPAIEYQVDSFSDALIVIDAVLGGAPEGLRETFGGEPITFDTHTRGKRSGWAHVSRKPDGWLITYGDARDGDQKPHIIFVRDASPSSVSVSIPAAVQPSTGKAEQAVEQAERAVQAAAEVWDKARPAEADHPYLKRKQVRPTETLRELPVWRLREIIGYTPSAGGEPLEGRILIAPVAIGDEVSTVEFIDEHGRKSALAGGRKSGGYWATGPLPDTGPVPIAEGIATALSIAEALGKSVVAALSVSNLKKVGRALERPGRELAIAADLGADGKPHQEAVKAAIELKARLYAPPSSLGKGADFNDLRVRDGLDAVRAAFANPGAPGGGQGGVAWLSKWMPTFDELRSDFRETHWLWRCWLPRGEFVIVAGAPGAGKTTAAVDIAAAVSVGDLLKGEAGKPHSVLFFTREDSYRSVILPKLIAAGGDPSRVRALEGLPDSQGSGDASFDPAHDVDRLRSILLALPETERPALIIFDGIADAVKRDSHNNTDVRHALLPYVNLARETGACVIGITHFSKNSKGRLPIDRVMGSVAFAAMARVVIAVRHNQGKDGLPERVFAQVKNNLAELQPAEGFQIKQAEVTINGQVVQTSVTAWTGKTSWTDDDGDDDGGGGALRDACDFLQDALSGGERPATDIIKDAQVAGISEPTLRRACKKLGVRKRKDGATSRSMWALPLTVPDASAGSGDTGSSQSVQDCQLDQLDQLDQANQVDQVGRQVDQVGRQADQVDQVDHVGNADQSRRRTDRGWRKQLVEGHSEKIEGVWWLTGEGIRDGQPFVARDKLIERLCETPGVTLKEAEAQLDPSRKGGLIHTLLEAGIVTVDPDGFRITGALAAELIRRSNGERLDTGNRERTGACLPFPEQGGSELSVGAGAGRRTDSEATATATTATETSLPGGNPIDSLRQCEICGGPLTPDAGGYWTCPACGI